jgi:predicted Zn-dependent protease
MNAATHNTQDSHLSGFDSRIVALDLLEDVLVRRQALDHALERSGALLDLDTRDRAFVRMIVATTLRKLGQIDDLINKTQDRPEALSSEHPTPWNYTNRVHGRP